MNLINLYNIAEKENIKVNNWEMPDTKARIINDVYTAIFIDYSKIESHIEEKEILAEEIGHYFYNAYYTMLDDQTFIDKQEYKAYKWKCLNLCSLRLIQQCFLKGIVKISDIAEELQIEPQTVEFAYNYYKENNLLKISA